MFPLSPRQSGLFLRLICHCPFVRSGARTLSTLFAAIIVVRNMTRNTDVGVDETRGLDQQKSIMKIREKSSCLPGESKVDMKNDILETCCRFFFFFTNDLIVNIDWTVKCRQMSTRAFVHVQMYTSHGTITVKNVSCIKLFWFHKEKNFSLGYREYYCCHHANK